MLGGVRFGFWLTGKLGRAWVCAWVAGWVHDDSNHLPTITNQTSPNAQVQPHQSR